MRVMDICLQACIYLFEHWYFEMGKLERLSLWRSHIKRSTWLDRWSWYISHWKGRWNHCLPRRQWLSNVLWRFWLTGFKFTAKNQVKRWAIHCDINTKVAACICHIIFVSNNLGWTQINTVKNWLYTAEYFDNPCTFQRIMLKYKLINQPCDKSFEK